MAQPKQATTSGSSGAYALPEEDELMLIILMTALMASVLLPLLMVISPFLLLDSPSLTALAIFMALTPGMLLSSGDFRTLMGELLGHLLESR